MPDTGGPGAPRPKPGPKPKVQRFGKADIPAVVELEKQCFSVPWSRKQYEAVVDNQRFHVFGLVEQGAVIAYITFFADDWEMEVLNIAVHPERRRRGLGQHLLGHVLQLCRGMGINRGYLEVRRSNVAAQGLYAAFGFEEVGVRKRYYPDNKEDALVMRLDMDPETSPDS
ncbi:ribosomal protein S18-alanine N-acetyltransferase [Fundidesulfovibrio agrisoli]|uniref:ribosomal protein S18-alanine N-acetyltransferase n=1 Tax=Fundidesulfovibrio agrisoli TaxID=2922717 RepID=UPI001FAC81AE|nr:ribosomal protein S18-alanine N-acetyltransferase [Fundidesulfovibrio agrisoli]